MKRLCLLPLLLSLAACEEIELVEVDEDTHGLSEEPDCDEYWGEEEEEERDTENEDSCASAAWELYVGCLDAGGAEDWCSEMARDWFDECDEDGDDDDDCDCEDE